MALGSAPGQGGDLVTAVLDYRHHDTLLTTFVEPYDALARYGDGRVRRRFTPWVPTPGA